MAKFTASVNLNLRLPGGFEAIGVAGTTHRIPDSLVEEFTRDQVPLIPGGVTWITQDETSSLVQGSLPIHGIASTYHSASGLTVGQVLQALTTSTFGFAANPAAGVTVTEIDGSPSSAGVTQLVFPNGAVAISSATATVKGVLPDSGGMETVNAIGSAVSTQSINIALGNVVTATLTSNCVFSFTGATNGKGCAFTIKLTQDSTGSRTVTWPNTVTWPGGIAPSLSTAAAAKDTFVFNTTDGGTTWDGFAAGAGTVNGVAIGGTPATGSIIQATSSTSSAWTPNRSTILAVIDPGAAITSGIKGDVQVDFACVIDSVTLLADQSGSIVIDVWKDTYANYPPTIADTITASAKPTLSSAAKSTDSTLTGWTTSIAAGDILRFNVDSATTVQRVTIAIKVHRV